MIKAIDQLGRTIIPGAGPLKIVSLVPSQTELLAHLGLDDEVVGITRFCVHPEHWYRTKTRVGGTKKVNHNTIASLSPNLIIANKEENTKEDIEKLEEQYPVWISDVNDLDSALQMIESIGSLVGRDKQASQLAQEIRQSFQDLAQRADHIQQRSVAYLIWKRPYMAAGRNTFIDSMLHYCGLENVVTDSRYPVVTISQLQEMQPGILLLSTEPYPFSDKDVASLRAELTNTSVRLVDGELFSWYGSRLLLSANYFRTQFIGGTVGL